MSLSACSTGSTGETGGGGGSTASADQFPVTIEHAFGETTIESVPERVATVSWVNADTALALGVVPVMQVNPSGSIHPVGFAAYWYPLMPPANFTGSGVR